MLQRKLRTSLVAFALLLGIGSALHAETVNQIILRVNDRVATLYDYLDRRSAMREEILRSDRMSPEDQERLLATLPKRVMQQIFRDLLLESRADQLEIFVGPDEVDDEIRRMQERNGIKTQKELEAALTSVGLTIDKFRAEFESELRVQRVVGQEVRSKVLLEEDDLRRYYRANPGEFRVPEKRETREFVVLEESTPNREALRALATDLVRRLRAGEDMEEIVAPLAEEGRTSSVIRLGWIAPGDLDETLEAALWSLGADEVSDPISGRGGLHILQLLDKEEEQLEPFSEVKDQIRIREQNRLFNEELENYLRELAQTAHIVEKIPADAEGYRSAMAGPLREPFQILDESDTPPPSDNAEPSSGAQATQQGPSSENGSESNEPPRP